MLTAGLRYSLLQPPYEANGNQAAPTISIGNLFAERAQEQLLGKSVSPGQNAANGFPGGPAPLTLASPGKPMENSPTGTGTTKISPHVFALAYSPHYDHGWLRSFFGAAGKSSVRMGYGLYFDHFGEGVVNTFRPQRFVRLDHLETNPYGVQDVDCASASPASTTCRKGSIAGSR